MEGPVLGFRVWLPFVGCSGESQGRGSLRSKRPERAARSAVGISQHAPVGRVRRRRRAGRMMVMATARTRGGRTPENPALAALRWLLAAVISLLFIAVGLALAFCGVIFAVVGAQQALGTDGYANVIAGALVSVLGLAGVGAAGALVLWLRPRAMRKLFGPKPLSFGGGSGGYYGGFFGGGGSCGGDGGGGGNC